MSAVRSRPSIEPLMEARSVVVVGASRDPERIGGRPLRFLKTHGFAGPLYAVNPSADEIDGVRCYPDIASLPEPVDLAILCLPAPGCVTALDACVERGIRAAVVFSGGFGEVGEEGKRLQQQLSDTAERGGILLCGPNSVGFVNIGHHLPATFAAPLAKPALDATGDVAFVVQSGAVGTFLYDWARERRLPISHFVSVGNEVGVHVGDYTRYLIEHPEVKVVGLHLEGIRHGRELLDAADRAVEVGKPICALKTGRSAAGQRAALSHTGALAGSDQVATDIFEQYGITRVEDPQDMLDFAQLSRLLDSVGDVTNVGVISTSGGMAVWGADQLETFGLTLPAFADATRARLSDLLPSYGSGENPVDMTGEIVSRPELATEGLEAVLGDPGVDAAVLMLAYQVRHGAWIASEVARIVSASDKPVLVVWMFIEPEFRETLEAAGVALFDLPGSGLRAFGRVVAARRRLGQLQARGERPPAPVDLLAADAAVQPITEHESKALLRQAGFSTPSSRVVTDVASATGAARELGYPVVLKGQAASATHKVDSGLVALGVADEAALVHEFEQICDRLRGLDAEPAVLVERYLTVTQEIILGGQRDAQFGPVVMFGAGGGEAEQVADVAFRAAPVTPEDASEMIRATQVGRGLLNGPAGPARESAAVAAVVAMSEFLCANANWIESVEINPLAFVEGSDEPVALDGLIIGARDHENPVRSGGD
jgi:acetate---CoA ligase (ADP-forming)